MIPIKVISTQEPEYLRVSFFPTDVCNFNCTYCFPGSHIERYRYPKNTDLIIKNFRILFDTYKKIAKKEKFHVMITGGGEPTVWPGLEKFCEEIKKTHDCYISLTTNGSRTMRWWEEHYKCFDDVVLSCHHEFVDIHHYINVADLLFESGLKVTALMLMDAKHWDKCVSYIDLMKASKHSWFIQTKEIIDAPGHGMDVYTPEQFQYVNDSIKRIPNSDWIFKRLNDMKIHESVVLFDNDTAVTSRPHSILTNGWNKFQGWTCNAGFESISIDPSGQVLAASCRQDPFGGKILNVCDENFDVDIQPKPIICKLNHCSCQPDTHITKWNA